ncbi:MAG: DUF3137 domain-containing protein [Elusimicrobia bacterium]|nr:DUF3137 domain-containing protein [Elusimicrobiota bacterium]
MTENDFSNLYSGKLADLAGKIPKVISGAGRDNFFRWSFSVAPVSAWICTLSAAAAILAFALTSPGKHGEPPPIGYDNPVYMPVYILIIVAGVIWIISFSHLQIYRAKFNHLLEEAGQKREELMTEVGAFFGLEYQPNPLTASYILTQCGLSNYTEYAEINYVLHGALGGCPLEIMRTEFKISENKHGPIMNEGLLALYPLDKKFEGTTILYEDSLLTKIGHINSKLSRVKLEWAQFEEAFDVYTTSQIDARTIMQPDFMEAVYNFRQQRSISDLFISFYDNKMLVFIKNDDWPYNPKNQFSPEKYYQKMDLLLKIPEMLNYKSFAKECFMGDGTGGAQNFFPPSQAPVNIVAPPANQQRLIDAVVANDIPSVRTLLEQGYDINCQLPENGNTPLHLAVWNDYADMARMLVAQRDVDLNMPNDDGKTPLDLAFEKNNQDMIDLLNPPSK